MNKVYKCLGPLKTRRVNEKGRTDKDAATHRRGPNLIQGEITMRVEDKRDSLSLIVGRRAPHLLPWQPLAVTAQLTAPE